MSRGAVVLACAALACSYPARADSGTPARNILVIICDQLARGAVGAYGNRDVRTPNIDRLAARGARFDRAYTAAPLCAPARASLWTGRMPHETGALSNQSTQIPSDMPTLGMLFTAAGYDARHFGKRHDSGSLRGFTVQPEGTRAVAGTEAWPVDDDTLRDRDTTEKVVEFLRRQHERPFLAVADLNNPHNICRWVGRNAGPHSDLPVPGLLPRLPANFDFIDLESRPLPIQYLCCTHHRLAQAARWDESNYRHYLAAYYHYVSRVDAEIGRIMRALDASSASTRTLVILLADHGDGMTAHRQVTKHVSFYEEAVRIPWIVVEPGGPRGVRIQEPLVSSIDLLPTLCDYAHVAVPAGLRGRSVRPWLHGGEADARRFVASEWHTEYGEAITPGRMLRTVRYKYTRYLEGNGEELFDLRSDPGERHNRAKDPAYQQALSDQRRLLGQYLQESRDPFLGLEVVVDPRWRSHALGYGHHEGPSAVEVMSGRSRGEAEPSP